MMVNCARQLNFFFFMIDYGEQKWLKINNRGVGIKMSWVEKNREINNLGGTIIRDSRVIKSSHTFGIFKKTIEFRIYVLWNIKSGFKWNSGL